MKLGRKRGEGKLYKQWVKHSDLPPEAIPQKKSHGEVPAVREKTRQGFRLLYILLGLGIIVLCVGLVFILIQSH